MGRIGRGERIRLYWTWERRIGLIDRFDNKYRGEIGCRISGQIIDF